MVLLSVLLLGLIGSALTHTESHCWDKKADPKGFNYRGHVNITANGLVCQRWDSQRPNSHKVTPQKYPKSGLDDNYCRNADGEPGPWCFNSKSTKPRWELCDIPVCPEAPDWTPFLNETTTHYKVGNFHLRFTQKKRVDKRLNILQTVSLYDKWKQRIGYTRFIFNIRPFGRRTELSGWKGFLRGSVGQYGGCTKEIKRLYLPYQRGANFEMITDVGSKEMFKFKIQGRDYVESMGDCWIVELRNWQNAEKLAKTMTMELYTFRYLKDWMKDFPDYFTTAYKVTKN